jgi:poly(hydroxyalkanoate) depolymerase family esterase
MNAFSKNDMIKATLLTRAGRLKDAVAVLRGARPAAEPTAPSPGLIDRLTSLGRRAAAPRTAPGARFESRVYAGEFGKRGYKLFIPSRYRGQALPLVVMLHGCTQSPDDFAAGTRMNELAEAEGFFVAYPAQSRAANMSRCWNWFNAADQQRGAGEPEIIAGIARQVMAEFVVKPDRIFAAGLSAGGALAAILGANYPDLFAAIGVHSGLACGAATDMASAFTAMRGGSAGSATARTDVPTIVFHGDHDQTVNAVNADRVIAQSRAAGLSGIVTQGMTQDGMAYTRTVQADQNGKPMLEKWILHGANHAWSGGSEAGSFASARGPDASREMWRFFMEASGSAPRFKWF